LSKIKVIDVLTILEALPVSLIRTLWHSTVNLMDFGNLLKRHDTLFLPIVRLEYMAANIDIL